MVRGFQRKTTKKRQESPVEYNKIGALYYHVHPRVGGSKDRQCPFQNNIERF